jgi:small redox-active disulfide protein 2
LPEQAKYSRALQMNIYTDATSADRNLQLWIRKVDRIYSHYAIDKMLVRKMVKIEVLGTGCAKCKSLLKNVEKAVEELGIQAEVVKVDGIEEIMSRGVMMTPALFIDGEAKAMGKVPSVEEIKRLLKK